MSIGALLPRAALALDQEQLSSGPGSVIESPAEPLPAGTDASPRLWIDGEVESVGGYRPQVVQGIASTRLVDASNRIWLGWGRAAIGFGLGAQSLRGDRPAGINIAGGVETDGPPQPTRPVMSVGWRYAVTASSSLYAGASAARAWGNDDALPLYRAKAGIEWKSAKSRLGFDGGRLGLQLDSGYRMSIRTRSGGVQVAVRRTF